MKKHNNLSKHTPGELSATGSLYEALQDAAITPNAILAVRVVAQRSRALNPLCNDYPFGKNATKAFLLTAQEMMKSCGSASVAYVHGDEITLVLMSNSERPTLRMSELISEVSSVGALAFFQHSGTQMPFYARVNEFASIEELVEYIFWRRRECYQRAVCDSLYRALQRSGHSDAYISSRIQSLTQREQLCLLEELETPITTIPIIIRRGSLLSWRIQNDRKSEDLKINFNTTIPDRDQHFDALLRELLTTGPKGNTENKVSPDARLQGASIKPTRTHRSFLPLRNKKAHVSVFKAVENQGSRGGPSI